MSCIVCDELTREIQKESANSNEIGASRREEIRDESGRSKDIEGRDNLVFAQIDVNARIRELMRQRDEHAATHQQVTSS